MKLTNQAASGVRWTTLSGGVSTATETLRTVVLARFLSPIDFGLMAMVMVVIGLAQTYVDLGISAAIIHRQDATHEQLSSLYWVNIVSGFVTFAILWFCTPAIVFGFREPALLPLLHAVALAFLIIPWGAQFEILLQKELKFQVLAKQEIVSSIGGLIVAVVGAVIGQGVWALAYSFLATLLIKTLLLMRIGIFEYRPLLHFRRADLKGYVGFGLFQLGERSINYISERLDQILIGPLLGAQVLGYYNFAFNLTARPISRINPILTRVAFPVFSRVQNDNGKLQRGYLKLVSFLTTVNAPLLVGLAATAPVAVPLIFGEKWIPAIILVQILSFMSLSRSVGNPIGSLQLAKGRADMGFWWNLLLFATSLPAIYIGGRFGAEGVALALLILQLVLQVPSYLYLIRPLIGTCVRDYVSAVMTPILAACLMGFAVIAIPMLHAGVPRLGELAAQLLFGGAIYLMLVRTFDKKVIGEFQTALFSR